MAKFAERIAFMQETSDVVRYLFESMTDPETISFGDGVSAGISEHFCRQP